MLGDNKALESVGIGEGVLDRKDPTPGLAVEHEALGLEAEGLPDLLHFVDKAIELPQRALVGLVAERRAKLVVVVVLNAGRRQIAVAGFEVLVGRARAAMKEKDSQRRVIADPLGPDLERTRPRVDGDHPDSPAERVVSPGVIEVLAHRIDETHARSLRPQ